MDMKSLLALAEIYALHYDITHWTLSYRVFRKGDFFNRLRAGRGCTVRSYNRAVQWFSDHWPAGVAWPADIPRPKPAAQSRRKAARKPKPAAAGKARKTGPAKPRPAKRKAA